MYNGQFTLVWSTRSKFCVKDLVEKHVKKWNKCWASWFKISVRTGQYGRNLSFRPLPSTSTNTGVAGCHDHLHRVMEVVAISRWPLRGRRGCRDPAVTFVGSRECCDTRDDFAGSLHDLRRIAAPPWPHGGRRGITIPPPHDPMGIATGSRCDLRGVAEALHVFFSFLF